MSINPGDFVIANAGRDLGKCFIVLSVENQFLYLCDGKNRKVSAPKRKNCRHVTVVGSGHDDICELIRSGSMTNKLIRRAISDFRGALAAEKR